MKNILFIFIIIIFSSCDYFESRDFVIINKLDSDITIKTSKGWDEIYFTDSIHTIKPNAKIMFTEDMGLCGKNNYAGDYFETNETLPSVKKFEIYIADTLVKRKILVRSNWSFESKKQVGIYSIEITEDLLLSQ